MIIRLGQSTVIIDGGPLLLCEPLTFQPGIVHCIRGRSGTGKTSFLRALAGLDIVGLSGSLEYVHDGEDPVQARSAEITPGHEIGFLRQSAGLWPHLSAFTNAWLPWASQCGIREMFRRREMSKQRARQWLEELGLTSTVWSRNPLSLSGGEQQRVALAATLVFDSPCLLLDEPTSSLDRASVSLVSRVLEEEAHRGKLVIVTSHDVDFLDNESWHHLAIVEQDHGRPRYRLREVS